MQRYTFGLRSLKCEMAVMSFALETMHAGISLANVDLNLWDVYVAPLTNWIVKFLSVLRRVAGHRFYLVAYGFMRKLYYSFVTIGIVCNIESSRFASTN